MPFQTQAERIVAMFENRSLVCEAKHDANAVIEAVLVVGGLARFGEMKSSFAATRVRLMKRFLSLRPGLMKRMNGFLLAGLGTIRNEFGVAFDALALPAAKPVSWLVSGIGFAHAASSGSLRRQIQFMPALVKLAARIGGLVASVTECGITRRSTGRPAAAR